MQVPPNDAAGAATVTAPDGDLHRLRRRIWWASAGVSYGVGAFTIVTVIGAGPPVAVGVGAGVASAAAAVASARLLQQRLAMPESGDPGGGPRMPAVAATALAGAVVFVVAIQLASSPRPPDGRPVLWFLIPGMVTGAVAAVGLARRRVVATATGALAFTALAAGTRFAAAGEVTGWTLAEGALVALMGVAIVSELGYWDVAVRLDRARRLEAALAVAGERLRFAADLHDIQGHHLQVIALKSELAARLAQVDPAAASGLLDELQEHARTALTDTRAVVQGYRRTPLAEELSNATRVLGAAGIDGQLAPGSAAAAGRVGEPGRQLLGLVVREATTNILRHSSAARARMELHVDGQEEALLEIHNDGLTSDPDPPGTGLPGLAQRIRSAGGNLEWGRGSEWFTVTARVPAGGEHLP